MGLLNVLFEMSDVYNWKVFFFLPARNHLDRAPCRHSTCKPESRRKEPQSATETFRIYWMTFPGTSAQRSQTHFDVTWILSLCTVVLTVSRILSSDVPWTLGPAQEKPGDGSVPSEMFAELRKAASRHHQTWFPGTSGSLHRRSQRLCPKTNVWQPKERRSYVVSDI